MRYTLSYDERLKKKIKKLDNGTKVILKKWIEKNLIGTTEPRRHGKGLTSNRSGQWRYRVGDYRIIADIEDEKLIILVVEVEHRSRVYK